MASNANPFLLAADNSPALITLLQANPPLAWQQDSTGYSLIHAAASYNHIELARSLIKDFSVPVDLRDGDEETALFLCETVEMARVLVEELGADPTLKNEEDMTAAEKIESEGDYVLVAAYLRGLDGTAPALTSSQGEELNMPEGMKVTFTSADEVVQDELPVDEAFRSRIEALAQRDDFEGEGQNELRALVEEAVKGKVLDPQQDGTEQRKKEAKS